MYKSVKAPALDVLQHWHNGTRTRTELECAYTQPAINAYESKWSPCVPTD